MSVQPLDIAIFLVSFAACIYCIVLSRRLKALQDTRDGLGATIMALSKSVSAVSSATQETRTQAGDLAARLGKLMQEADATCKRMNEFTRAQDEAQARLRKTADAERADIAASMNALQRQSDRQMDEIRSLMKQLKSLSKFAGAARSSDFLFDEDEPALAERKR